MRAVLGGSRPVYVYDLATVRARIAALRAALPPRSLIVYAMKANSHPDVVRAAAETADGLEVASGGELAAAAVAAPALTVFSGPAKSDDDLRAAVSAGAVLNVESLHELRRVAAVAGAGRICLRVNRAHAALPGSHRMTGVATQFGMGEEDLDEAAAIARRDGHELLGFHLHAVSNNLDAAAHATYIRDCVTWALPVADRLGIDRPWVNTGGGFGVDMTGTTGFDLTALRQRLTGDPKFDAVQLVVEPGRIAAADAGWYAAEVVDVKRSHGQHFVVVRGGTHHFRLPASWGYSHPFTVLAVEDWPYPWPRPEVRDADVTVAGEQCNPRDVLARGEHVTRVRAGDVLLFARTGAYGWEVAHHDFLRLAHPRFTAVDGPED